MKTLIFDLDGTCYRGPEPIEAAIRAIDFCYENKIPYLFLTNNSMRSAKENADHMLKMGFHHIEPEMFYNSAMASAQYVREKEKGNKAYYIGQNGMKSALEEYGFEISDDHPDFVFIGLNKEADYHMYSRALDHLLHGARLIGTNKDRILAKPGGFEVGNGSVVALFEYATDTKSPDIGKPSYEILRLCLQHYHLRKEEVVLIGDNLETDIALGYNNQVESVFVQSGVHHEEDIERLKIVPDHVVESLDELDLFTIATN